jgi:hypothetical protein
MGGEKERCHLPCRKKTTSTKVFFEGLRKCIPELIMMIWKLPGGDVAVVFIAQREGRIDTWTGAVADGVSQSRLRTRRSIRPNAATSHARAVSFDAENVLSKGFPSS